MKYIGIDPGCSGGVCIIDSINVRNVLTYSLDKCTIGDIANYFNNLRLEEEQAIVYLENPSLPPTNVKRKSGGTPSVQGYTKLFRSIGQLEGILVSTGYIPTLINPRTWMSQLGVLTGGDKRVTLNEAIKLFPFYAKREGVTNVTHSIADAMLIALLCYLDHMEPKYIIGEFKHARYKPSRLSKGSRYDDSTSSNERGNSKSSVSSSTLRQPKGTIDLTELFGSDE